MSVKFALVLSFCFAYTIMDIIDRIENKRR